MYIPTLAPILSLPYLFFHRAPLKCVNPLTHRKICQCNKRRILYNLLLLCFKCKFILKRFKLALYEAYVTSHFGINLNIHML